MLRKQNSELLEKLRFLINELEKRVLKKIAITGIILRVETSHDRIKQVCERKQDGSQEGKKVTKVIPC